MKVQPCLEHIELTTHRVPLCPDEIGPFVPNINSRHAFRFWGRVVYDIWSDWLRVRVRVRVRVVLICLGLVLQ